MSSPYDAVQPSVRGDGVWSFHKEAFSIIHERNSNPDKDEIKEIPLADSFAVVVQLQDFLAHKLWHGKTLVFSGGYKEGTVALPYMGNELRCQHLSAFDTMKFIIPRKTFDAVLAENASVGHPYFNYEQDNQDLVLYHLARAVIPALRAPGTCSQLFMDSVIGAMCTHAAAHYGPGDNESTRGPTLAKWQESRVKELIESRLNDNQLSVITLADECGLSRSHFSRAFKSTLGMAPHAWMTTRRVERATRLMRNFPQMMLSEVALECGFADQSHFIRVFFEFKGATPCVWRRCDQGA